MLGIGFAITNIPLAYQDGNSARLILATNKWLIGGSTRKTLPVLRLECS